MDDEINGFLIPVKDSEALANRLRLLIDNKQLREKMGAASRLKAEKDFSLDVVIKKHLEVYDSLL